ncbi:MAG: S8 family serine peptidase [Alistipes sp.]|nr:S8 family serine peptidase [Alistipes sp.]
MKNSLIAISVAIISILMTISCTKDAGVVEGEMATDAEIILSQKLVGNTIDNCKEGTLLLFLEEETIARIDSGDMEAVKSEIFVDKNIICFEPALHTPKNERLARELGLHRWYSVTFDSNIPVRKFAAEVAPSKHISAIEYNTMVTLAADYKVRPFSEGSYAETKATEISFNDPYAHYQWNLHNTGDKSIAETAREGADVGVLDAWTLCAGSPDVVVAVIDGPVKYTHPDLAASMWVNEAELNGIAGVDDDGNKYVDDIYGYNFNTAGYSNGQINWTTSGESGHGTHVAGIIAAVNNNGIGVSSVAGGSGNGDGVRIMGCQVFDGSYAASDRDMSNAFIYAADNGACIAQCSYGYDPGSYASDNAYINATSLEYNAIKYFVNPANCNHPSIGQNLVIFASGNETTSNAGYPGALPICVSVTAYGPDYLPTGYTNYGRGCNIAAPGGDYSIGAQNSSNKSQILSTCVREVAGDDYVWMEGTSMACPHVSSVVALGISYAAKIGKKFNGDEYRDIVLTSVNDINSLLLDGTKPYNGVSNAVVLNDYYKRMGTGAIDTWRLFMQIEGTPSIVVATGERCSIDLAEYFGGSATDLTYLGVEVSDEAKETLGISGNPTMKKGLLEIKCTKNGSAKITVSAIAGGGQLGGGNNIGGTEIKREVSIISRGVYSTNGGWF